MGRSQARSWTTSAQHVKPGAEEAHQGEPVSHKGETIGAPFIDQSDEHDKAQTGMFMNWLGIPAELKKSFQQGAQQSRQNRYRQSQAQTPPFAQDAPIYTGQARPGLLFDLDPGLFRGLFDGLGRDLPLSPGLLLGLLLSAGPCLAKINNRTVTISANS